MHQPITLQSQVKFCTHNWLQQWLGYMVNGQSSSGFLASPQYYWFDFVAANQSIVLKIPANPWTRLEFMTLSGQHVWFCNHQSATDWIFINRPIKIVSIKQLMLW